MDVVGKFTSPETTNIVRPGDGDTDQVKGIGTDEENVDLSRIDTYQHVCFSLLNFQ